MARRCDFVLSGESEKIIEEIPRMFKSEFIREAIIYYAQHLGRKIKDEDTHLRMLRNEEYLKNRLGDMIK